MTKRPLIQASQRVEEMTVLDSVSQPARGVVTKLITTGSLKDLLSGTWLGHPVHPMLVGLPIGSWVGATILDLGPGQFDATARRLVGLGVLAAMPTALAGLSDWTDTTGAEQRVGTLHAMLNLTAVALYSGSWMARRRTKGAGKVLALAGAAVMGAAGYLGGHLSYSLGVGVDTNAFQTGPDDWQAVGSEADLGDSGEPRDVSAGGVSIVVVKQRGRLHALANRCSHRGGPLSDGDVKGGCITCPWHASEFDLDSGQVTRGPAVHPQPVYEVRAADGQLYLRRSETRSLRKNPVAAK